MPLVRWSPVRFVRRLSWVCGVLLLLMAVWEAWPPLAVRSLLGAERLFQRSEEGACVAVAKVTGGVGERLDLLIEGPFVAEGCRGCPASGP